MLSEQENKRLSRLLSYILRHHPEHIGIQLDENGWAETSLLIKNLQEKEPAFSLEILRHIVDSNSKKRFAFNEDGAKIRASQGHSVNIELGYTEQQPPEFLFHGTAEKNLPAIFENGLHKMERHHVHLSAGKETARSVGARHGKPVVLTIRSATMYGQGYKFYVSDNGVWLTENVPAEYIQVLADSAD